MTAVAKSRFQPGASADAPLKRPSLLLGAVHLAALWALAFAQPMLSLLGSNPEFFVARGNGAGQIILYALVLTLGPPLIGLLLETVARLISRNVQWYLHLVLMTLVGACFFLQMIKKYFEWSAWILITLSVLLALACVFLYASFRFPRSFMDILSVAPVVILLLFFGFSSTSRLVLPREQPEPVDVAITKPVPVVMMIFDEFPVGSLMTPSGQIDRSRYPAFAEMAGSSTWYRNATAAGSYTPLAVPAILTGQTPDHEKLPIAADHPHSLFTLLGKQYDLRVMETATRVCPEELCPSKDNMVVEGDTSELFSDLFVVSKYLLLPDSMTRNLPDISNTFSGFRETDEVGISSVSRPTLATGASGPTGATGETGATGPTGETKPIRTGQGGARRLGRLFALESSVDEFERVSQFNSRLTSGQEETLDLIHVEKPHLPWRHFPEGQRYTNLNTEWAGLLPNDGPWMAPPRVVNIAMQRHLLEVGYTDTLLARIIDRLKKTGLWDEALIVAVADHGTAFQSNVPRRTAIGKNMGEIASVPLFIKSPGQDEPVVTDERTCSTDILPEIADQLGIEYPWEESSCDPDEVTVINSPEGEASTSVDKMLTQRRKQLINRIDRVFGTGQGWGPVYRFGPYKELIGKRVRNLKTEPMKHQLARPDERNAAKNFSPDMPNMRGLLQRGTTPHLSEKRVLAVAVGGKIRAVGWTFEDGTDRGPGYSILLPPDSLKPGFNQVDIYLVKENGTLLTKIYDGSKPLPAEAVQKQNQARAAALTEMEAAVGP